MRCIFCGRDSLSSQSREHILPEALGNEEHVLPRGVVCDACNSYFGLKIEGPLLDGSHFNNLRARQQLPNKRGRLPIARGVYPAARIGVGLQRGTGGLSVGPLRERDNGVFARAIQSSRRGSFWVPNEGRMDHRLLCRFLGKVGVELLASRFLSASQSSDELLNTRELEAIRRFVRQGDRPLDWPISRRRIYPEDAAFGDQGSDQQVLHEFDLLFTDTDEVYAVICIFGEEFAINLGGPSIDGYLSYLARNKGRSPLYDPGELEGALRLPRRPL